MRWRTRKIVHIINNQTRCDYSIFTHLTAKKSKRDFHRAEDSMRKFCVDLRACHWNNWLQKVEMLPLTKKRERKSYSKQHFCHICQKEFNDDNYDENYRKIWDCSCYTWKYSAFARIFCNLTYKTPNKFQWYSIRGQIMFKISSWVWRTLWVLKKKKQRST